MAAYGKTRTRLAVWPLKRAGNPFVVFMCFAALSAPVQWVVYWMKVEWEVWKRIRTLSNGATVVLACCYTVSDLLGVIGSSE
jgi:hypothetical protein